MNSIGMLCNCTLDGDPKTELSPSLINRAFLIDRIVRRSGFCLFLYSPRHVTASEGVDGYRVEGNELVAAREPVPRVNANWTYGTRKLINQGMGYRRFKRWAKQHEIGIYVPYAFSELVSNKRKAYEVVREFKADLHPHTEDYSGARAQIESFLARSDVVFVKPRAGNRGNGIFVLRSGSAGCSLKYYDQGSQRAFSPITVEAALGTIDVAAADKNYIVQEGVESLRHEGSVFDIRVVMVSDGAEWHALLESRRAPADSDLSNVFQGGSIEVTEKILEDVFDTTRARELTTEVRDVSHGLAEHLGALYPGELMEIGLDFVLSREHEPYLVEVNAKPGISGFGSEATLFDWRPEDEAYYRQSVYPHVDHLAAFLLRKAESSLLSGT